MVRVNREVAKDYISSGVYFGLKNDGNKVEVRFPYNSLDELFTYDIVHDIGEPQKSKYIDCLREPEDSIDMCPFCAAGMNPKAKLFLQVYDVKEKVMKIWDRGITLEAGMMKDLRDIRKDPIIGAIIQVERFGAKGASDTTYAFDVIPADEDGKVLIDDTTTEDLPDFVDIYELNIVTKLNSEEMEIYLETDQLPNKDNKNNKEEVKRRLSNRGEDTRGEKTKANKTGEGSRRIRSKRF